ncbi:hypothetical protein COCVIDRAFT_94311 [Bipolaris victoriae FI3]|uniref:Uncharacterized protein n=1 Tax=Bipolaris victoriae (strain FI3) TaxID=930091 RepID=W7ELA5_BIPV3|nr:hypothetical protein COCVIDRAFT_94311 [Bipolaris victoriae FI3]
MAPNIPDHWLWLGLGVFTFIAVQQVSHGLQNMRTLTAIHNPQNVPSQRRTIPSSPRSPTHQEDAIKTSSLLTLATSHNNDIRASATKILCTRFYASKTAKDLLIKDLYSKDQEVVHRAQLAFNLLCDMGVWRDSSLAPRIPRGGWRLMESRAQVGGVGSSERDVRRRRREAVVISDGEGTIASRGVFARDHEGEDDQDDVDSPGLHLNFIPAF